MSPPRDHAASSPATESTSSIQQLRALLSSGSSLSTRPRQLAESGTTGTDAFEPGLLEPPDLDDTSGQTVLTAEDVLALAGPVALPRAPLAPLHPGSPRELPPLDLDADLDDTPAVKAKRLRDRRHRRRHGVAPFVRPAARRSRRRRRRDYRKLGFIELTQERLRLRHRILPRTVIGISTMILALGVGAAFAGASLYAYYDYRVSQNETRIDEFAKGFEKNFTSALGQLQGVRDQAILSVNGSLAPLQAWQDDANAVVELPTKVGGGVFTVRTFDLAGKPVVGSAFVVSSDTTSSLLLTSHELIAAATAQPGPKVIIEKGGEQLQAEVLSWDETRDVASLKVSKPLLPALVWATEDVRAAARGSRVYAVSGLGGAGAKATGGMVVDTSSVGLQHSIPFSQDFRGGPIVTADGKVLAVSTADYRPLGFDPGPLPYAPSVTAACEKVLVCPASLVAPTGTAQPGGR